LESRTTRAPQLATHANDKIFRQRDATQTQSRQRNPAKQRRVTHKETIYVAKNKILRQKYEPAA
jgi:hypothetical protein